MLPNSAAATALPFELEGQAAAVDAITNDFGRVTGMAAGHVAEFYKQPDSLQLPQSVIDARLLHTLQGFEGLMRAAMTGLRRISAYRKNGAAGYGVQPGPGGAAEGVSTHAGRGESGGLGYGGCKLFASGTESGAQCVDEAAVSECSVA